jgi:hypothetical protein
VRYSDSDWTDDAWELDAGFDDDVDDPNDDEPTLPCPFCGEEVHEDAQRCPYCEQYLSEEDRPTPRKPWWIVVGALAALYAVYRWIVW